MFLIRAFVVISSDGTTREVPEPAPDRVREEPLLPRIFGFPTGLQVWVDDETGLHNVLQLEVKRERLLANFADADSPGDRRWWEDWDEAAATGVAGVVPAADLHGGINALFVSGLGDSDPAALFGDLAAEGRLGLLAARSADQCRGRRSCGGTGDRPGHLVGRAQRQPWCRRC